jgi:hypothetical protein
LVDFRLRAAPQRCRLGLRFEHQTRLFGFGRDQHLGCVFRPQYLKTLLFRFNLHMNARHLCLSVARGLLDLDGGTLTRGAMRLQASGFDERRPRSLDTQSCVRGNTSSAGAWSRTGRSARRSSCEWRTGASTRRARWWRATRRAGAR